MVHPQLPHGSIHAMVTPPDRSRPAALFLTGVFFSLGATVTLLALFSVYSIRAILVRVLVALFITVSLEPAVHWLTQRGVRRGLAVTLIFAVAFIALLAFLTSVIPQLVNQGRQLIDDLPGYLAELQARSAQFRGLNDRFNLTGQLQGIVGSVPSRIGSGVLGFTGRLFGAVFSALTVLVFTAYFMADLPRLRNGLVWLFPAAQRPRAKQVVDLLIDKVGGYMIGNIIVSIIAGVSSYVAFRLLGVSFAVPLAFLVAVFDLIPMIGATLGAVVGVTVALFTTPLWPNTVLVAAFFIAYQQVENYLIAPRVLKTTVDIGAAAVLLAGLVGATLLGLVGALMAIPVAAALNVLLNERLQAREGAAGGPDAVAAAGEVAAPSEVRDAAGHPAASPSRPDGAGEHPAPPRRPDLAGGGEIKG
jgi:predicted PurR-regulated permease PerM